MSSKFFISRLLTVLLSVASLNQIAHGATLTVTKVADTADGSCSVVDCSLREALTVADSDTPADTIVFKAGLSGTIALEGPLPPVVNNVTITGPTNSAIAISGNNVIGIFTIQSTSTFAISNLTLRNGNAVNGGAINNRGQLDVQKCLFTQNSATLGGAIWTNVGGVEAVRLINCTFTGNTSSQAGGAIFQENQSMIIDRCTIVGNTNTATDKRGGGGLGWRFAEPVGGDALISNTIIVRNTPDDVNGIGAGSANVRSAGYNLGGTGFFASMFYRDGDKRIGTEDPGLTALANNGGPTQTIALIGESPAVNAGDPNIVGTGETDQRNLNRVTSGRMDMGAYETRSTPPINISVTPNTGGSVPGAGRILTAVYTDANGANSITDARILINGSLVAANSLTARYTGGKLYLLSDNGTTYLGGFTPGSNNVISNNQGTLNCASTQVAVSGTTLTIKWSFTPKTAFLGAKRIYSWVSDGGEIDGWDEKGTWLVNAPPTNVSVTPASGSSVGGAARAFTTVHSDPNGFATIQEVRVLVNSTLAVPGSMTLRYFNGRLYVLNDAGTGYIGGVLPGSSGEISNSRVRLDCGRTTVSGSGNNLTINWSVYPKQGFVGAKSIYALVVDNSGGQDGWDSLGTWTITAGSFVPVNVSVAPSNGFTYINTVSYLTTVYTDASGADDITDARIAINGTLSGANGIIGRYAGGLLYLATNDGTNFSGGFAPGSNQTISNSQGTLNCATTTVTKNGNTLTIRWSYTPKSTFAGSKKIYSRVVDASNQVDGWDQMGSVLIQLPFSEGIRVPTQKPSDNSN